MVNSLTAPDLPDCLKMGRRSCRLDCLSILVYSLQTLQEDHPLCHEQMTVPSILDRWRLPVEVTADLDDPATTIARQALIRRKRFLYKLYCSFYRDMAARLQGLPDGPIIELGSGAGCLKEILPRVYSSDLFVVPGLDVVLSAQRLPFKDGSVGGLLMLNVFHHLPQPIRFLQEAERCLIKGGRLVMIEPYNTPFARFIYQRFHHECFDPQAGWEHQGRGPLSGANGALPWILFDRDAREYQRQFPRLPLRTVHLHTPFAYLLSGGLSFRSFLPGNCFGAVRRMEQWLSPLRRQLAMFATICLERT